MAASRYFRGDGVFEYLIVLALFALAAVGAVAIFGDDLRSVFGIGPPQATAPASGDTTQTPPASRTSASQ